jgi:hypothetical protein
LLSQAIDAPRRERLDLHQVDPGASLQIEELGQVTRRQGREGAKFWLRVMNELKNRGVDDLLFAVVDGLKGFPDAITAVSVTN